MSTPVRSDQFVATAEGITHKPTGATFTPYAGERYVVSRLYRGQLGNVLDNGDDFRDDEVREMMFDLWAKYHAGTAA